MFATDTSGSTFTTLHTFQGHPDDGSEPLSDLILSGNTLYGTTRASGSSGLGTVFAVNADGTSFRLLHNFTFSKTDNGYVVDGGSPYAGVVLLGNTLYGTATSGGDFEMGVVFKVNTDGSNYAVLYSFNDVSSNGVNSDGIRPYGKLAFSDNTFYGTANLGGSSGKGTVFSLSLTPQLSIVPSGPNIVLSWPTNDAGFDKSGYALQSATTLASPIWSTNLPTPVIINGQNTVTIPISCACQFFRLSQ